MSLYAVQSGIRSLEATVRTDPGNKFGKNKNEFTHFELYLHFNLEFGCTQTLQILLFMYS